jgi:hypothetical protein
LKRRRFQHQRGAVRARHRGNGWWWQERLGSYPVTIDTLGVNSCSRDPQRIAEAPLFRTPDEKVPGLPAREQDKKVRYPRRRFEAIKFSLESLFDFFDRAAQVVSESFYCIEMIRRVVQVVVTFFHDMFHRHTHS